MEDLIELPARDLELIFNLAELTEDRDDEEEAALQRLGSYLNRVPEPRSTEDDQ